MDITSTAPGASLSAEVAEEIRAWMGRRRITGAQIARELHVSQMWVSDRLGGKTPITVNDLQRIASVLQVPVIKLFPEDVRSSTLRYLAGFDRPADPRAAGQRPRRLTPSLAVAC